MTVLSVAASNGTDVAVRSLLERDASNVDAVNNEARTALHRACEQGRAEVVRQFFKAGADPTLRDNHDRTAVDLAAGNGHQGCGAHELRGECLLPCVMRHGLLFHTATHTHSRPHRRK
eukprot:37270-Eustigmatos_ZCMA.PRE.1